MTRSNPGVPVVSGSMTWRNSTTLPGQPCSSSSGSAGRLLRVDAPHVQIETVDARELRIEAVEPRLLRAPVEVVRPYPAESAHDVEIDPGLPRAARQRLRPSRRPQPRAQVVEHVVADVDRRRSQRGRRHEPDYAPRKPRPPSGRAPLWHYPTTSVHAPSAVTTMTDGPSESGTVPVYGPISFTSSP